MIDLYGLKLSDMLPSSIMGDSKVLAMAAALDKELQAITACINEVVMLPRIDELPEATVDHLAGQLHVDYYEPLGLGLDKKRALVKSSLSWHRRKGTKSVLEEIIRILFLDDFKIEEWFEYGGEPYFFRLIVNEDKLSREQYKGLIRAVYELKNVRSWLERIIKYVKSECTLYFGIAGKIKKKSNIDSIIPPGQIMRPVSAYLGFTGIHKKKYEIQGDNPEIKINAPVIYTGITGKQLVKSFAQFRRPVITVADCVIRIGVTIKMVSKTTINFKYEEVTI